MFVAAHVEASQVKGRNPPLLFFSILALIKSPFLANVSRSEEHHLHFLFLLSVEGSRTGNDGNKQPGRGRITSTTVVLWEAVRLIASLSHGDGCLAKTCITVASCISCFPMRQKTFVLIEGLSPSK